MEQPEPIPGSEPSPLFTQNPEGLLDADISLACIVQVRSKLPEPATDSAKKPAPPMPKSVFLEQIAASDSDMKIVTRYAEENDLEVTETNTTVGAVWLTGSVKNFDNAFGVKMRWFQYDNALYYGSEGPIKVPLTLLPLIKTVVGLNNFPVYARLFPDLAIGAEPMNICSPMYSPDQLAALYRFPHQYRGEGQCHGIWSLGGGFYQEEIENYYRSLLIPEQAFPRLSWVGDNNPTPKPELTEAVLKLWGRGVTTGSTNQTAWTLETTLDVELATTLAPAAHTVVFFPPSQSETELEPSPEYTVLETLYQIILDEVHQPRVIAASWAYYEAFSRESFMKVFSNWLGALTTQGVTFCFSSGNWGSIVNGVLSLGFPASSPYTLGCGGTRLLSANKKTIDSETVWNQLYGQTFFASTGGASTVFKLPLWQTTAGVVAKTGISGRGAPDVAADSDFETGVYVLIGGVSVSSAGTSAAAQTWGALLTRINQGLGFPIGYFNPVLYQWLAQIPRDITQGDNFPNGEGPRYTASPGWDPCCGLGTPDGQALLKALKEIWGLSETVGA